MCATPEIKAPYGVGFHCGRSNRWASQRELRVHTRPRPSLSEPGCGRGATASGPSPPAFLVGGLACGRAQPSRPWDRSALAQIGGGSGSVTWCVIAAGDPGGACLTQVAGRGFIADVPVPGLLPSGVHIPGRHKAGRATGPGCGSRPPSSGYRRRLAGACSPARARTWSNPVTAGRATVTPQGNALRALGRSRTCFSGFGRRCRVRWTTRARSCKWAARDSNPEPAG